MTTPDLPALLAAAQRANQDEAWWAANGGPAAAVEAWNSFRLLFEPSTVTYLVQRAIRADELERMERERWASATKALGVPAPCDRKEPT